MAPILSRFAVATGAIVHMGDSIGIELEVGFKIIAPLPAPETPDFEAKLVDAVRPVPVIELVVNGGVKTCHRGGAKVGHLVPRLGARCHQVASTFQGAPLGSMLCMRLPGSGWPSGQYDDVLGFGAL